jgi:5-methylthioadenosine/S-adenosylhomocysteine deaminase
MDGTPIRAGQVVIQGGVIKSILSASSAPPAGAIVIDTKGFIYPGLMNLHNHVEYNILPLYNVPKHSENRYDWPGGKSYETFVNNPWKVTTDKNIFGLTEEANKYGEIRAIIGGETAIQGADNVKSVSTTLVRNVETDTTFGPDFVGARTPPIDGLFMKHLPEQINRIRSQKAWFFHLAEGIDEKSRLEFSNPAFNPAEKVSSRNKPGVVEAGLLWPGLVGIHSTGLTEAEFRAWKEATGQPKIVWSPTSNLMLYGKTTDVKAAARQGALIALGTDWAPSGTKNMLWELKTVDHHNKTALGRFFSDKQIIEMATTNAAKMLGWETKVGKIRIGMAADLVVLDDLPGPADGYRNMINAVEANVQLVLVGGNPLYGDEAHMKRLKTYDGQAQYEVLPETKGARPKAIDMKQDPAVSNLSVAEIKARLETALSLDKDVLAARLNAGVRETATRTTYDAREYVKAELVKLLTAKNKPVPETLKDKDSRISPEHAALFVSMKYPNVAAGPRRLETLYTDRRFFEDLASNLHWKEPYTVNLDLAAYAPAEPSSTPGLAGSVPNQ